MYETTSIEKCLPLLMGSTTFTARMAVGNFCDGTFYLGTRYLVTEKDRKDVIASKIQQKYGLDDKADWVVDNHAEVIGIYQKDGGRITGKFKYMIVPRTERHEFRKKSLFTTQSTKRCKTDRRLKRQSVVEIPDSYSDQLKYRDVTYVDKVKDLDVLVWFAEKENVPKTKNWWDLDTNKIRKRYPYLEDFRGCFSPRIERGMDILEKDVLNGSEFKPRGRKKFVQDSKTYRTRGYKLIGVLTSPDGHVVYYETEAERPSTALVYYPCNERKERRNEPIRIKVAGTGDPPRITHVLEPNGTIVGNDKVVSVLKLKDLT